MRSLTKISFALLSASVVAIGAAHGANNYIGAKRCKNCHEFEFRVWSQGPHAVAQKSLTDKQLGDKKCNTCHTMLPDNLAERYLGVQCERCHGAGKHYHAKYVMKDKELVRAVGLVDPTELHCRQCHSEGAPSVQPFDYATMWAEIDHGAEARAAAAAVSSGGS